MGLVRAKANVYVETLLLANHNEFEVLKIWALILMVVDHVHLVFFQRRYEFLTVITRTVAPIFMLVVAQNLFHGAAWKKYLMRCLPFAILAQGFYAVVFQAAWLNILFTLALAVLLATVTETFAKGWLNLPVWIGVVVLAVLSGHYFEYGFAGLISVAIFLKAMRHGQAWWLAISLWCFLMSPQYAFVYALTMGGWQLWSSQKFFNFKRLPWWFFYGFYPSHLLLIWLALKGLHL